MSAFEKCLADTSLANADNTAGSRGAKLLEGRLRFTLLLVELDRGLFMSGNLCVRINDLIIRSRNIIEFKTNSTEII